MSDIQDTAARMQAVMRKLVHLHMKALSASELDSDLSRSQVTTLLEIGGAEPATMGEVADALGIAPGSLTGIVDRLIEKDLALRDRSAQDRRKVLVSLTARGRAVFKGVRESQSKMSDLFLGLLSPGEDETLLGLMEKLVKGLEGRQRKISLDQAGETGE